MIKRTHLIGYDLVEGDKYEILQEAIKALDPESYWHHLDSTWIVRSDKSPAQIRDLLKPKFFDKDNKPVVRKLLVIDITNVESADYGL